MVVSGYLNLWEICYYILSMTVFWNQCQEKQDMGVFTLFTSVIPLSEIKDRSILFWRHGYNWSNVAIILELLCKCTEVEYSVKHDCHNLRYFQGIYVHLIWISTFIVHQFISEDADDHELHKRWSRWLRGSRFHPDCQRQWTRRQGMGKCSTDYENR